MVESRAPRPRDVWQGLIIVFALTAVRTAGALSPASSLSSSYGESWASTIARFVEYSCGMLGITVTQWTPSIFMGTLAGIVAAIVLHARDAAIRYRKRRRGKGPRAPGEPSLMDELDALAGEGARGAARDEDWTLLPPSERSSLLSSR